MNRTIDTKDRILDAAERLFAEGGYAATSLRSIIAAAGVNLAAVHYHFHSKEMLLEAVLVRRAEPINQERLDLLEACEREAGDGPPSVEKVLEAFLLPPFRMAAEGGGQTFVRLMARLYSESDLLADILVARFAPLLLRFGETLTRALPHVPPQELFWRSRLALGAASQVLIESSKPKPGPNGSDPSAGWQDKMRRLIAFLSAGFSAPAEEAPANERVRAQEMK